MIVKECSQLRYTLQHETNCNKLSFISRSKFKSLHVLQVFILTDQVSYPSNRDFPNFPRLNCSVNGQDTDLSADRSPHNVLVIAEHPKKQRYGRFMRASIFRDAALILQVWLLGFISSSATPFTEDFWLWSPLGDCTAWGITWSPQGDCTAFTHLWNSPSEGKNWSMWLNLTRYRSSLTPGLALPPSLSPLSWRYSQQIIYYNQSSDPIFTLQHT